MKIILSLFCLIGFGAFFISAPGFSVPLQTQGHKAASVDDFLKSDPILKDPSQTQECPASCSRNNQPSQSLSNFPKNILPYSLEREKNECNLDLWKALKRIEREVRLLKDAINTKVSVQVDILSNNSLINYSPQTRKLEK